MSIILNPKVICYDTFTEEILSTYHRITVISIYNCMEIEQKIIVSLDILRRETSQ